MTSEEDYFPLPPNPAPEADSEPRKKCPRSVLIVFFSCLAVVALGKIFWYSLMTQIKNYNFTYVAILVCFVLSLTVLVCFILLLKQRKLLCACLCLAGFLLALFLPLTDFYESARFAVLRPMREQVATEIAEAYEKADDPAYREIGFSTAHFPSASPLVARQGKFFCELDRKNIRVYFLRYDNGLYKDYEVFLTDIPYTGPEEDATSDGYDYAIPHNYHGSFTLPLAEHWLIYCDPYSEKQGFIG